MFLTSFHRAIFSRKEFSFFTVFLLSLQFLHYGLIFSPQDYLLYESPSNQKDTIINVLQHNLGDECILIENSKASTKSEQSFTKTPFISPNNSENIINRFCKKYFPMYSVSSVSIDYKFSNPRSPPLLFI